MDKNEINKKLEDMSNDFIKKLADFCAQQELEVKIKSLSFSAHLKVAKDVKALGDTNIISSCKKNKDGQVVCS